MYDVERMKAILFEAGEIAKGYFTQVTPTLKKDKTYVTEADLKVQSYLRSELEKTFPEDGIMGEEEELRRKPSSGSRMWGIDPIDGTASFVLGLPFWGIRDLFCSLSL